MKKYNVNTGKIEELSKTIVVNGVAKYTSKMTDVQLIEAGFYPISFSSVPDRKYYTYTESSKLVNNIWTIAYNVEPRDTEEVKQRMLKDLSDTFKVLSKRPKVDTTLGFIIDGGREDLENLKVGKEFNLPFIKDANGINHSITNEDYDTAILAIKQNGINLYQTKWNKKAEIDSFTTIEQCILYEATPYEEEIEEIDETTLEPTGNMIVVTKYRNNVKEW
jgi:hypothetical protein